MMCPHNFQGFNFASLYLSEDSEIYQKASKRQDSHVTVIFFVFPPQLVLNFRTPWGFGKKNCVGRLPNPPPASRMGAGSFHDHSTPQLCE